MERLLAAPITQVFAGQVDPYPEVAGKGVARLRRAGVRVNVGVLEDECREQHRGFLSLLERGRPFVSLKLATTLDGRIATATGESRWITGAEARAEVHRLRARCDAILLDLRRGLSVLGKRGLSEVLVEGGGGIAAGLLRQDLVDEVHWFVAPRMLGSDALPALGRLDISKLSRATTLEDVRVRRVGSDVYLRGRPVRRGKAGRAR